MTVTEDSAEALTTSAAAELGSVDTLRDYGKEGMTLHRRPRSSSGQRRYTQQTGLPIRDIKHFGELNRQDDSEPRRLAILETHRLHVLEQFDEVQTRLAAINKMIDNYKTRMNEREMSS